MENTYSIAVSDYNGKEVTESRQVAKLVGKSHKNLMRDIHNYCEHLAELNFELSEFFTESTYTDTTGRTLPCYLITKKGCEMIANKMTGKKGTIFTAAYINAFHDMKQQISNNYDEMFGEIKKCFAAFNNRIEKLEGKQEYKKPATIGMFVPPTVGQVEDYCDELGEWIDAERFVDYYESIGWLVGNKPMKNWKASVRCWIRMQY